MALQLLFWGMSFLNKHIFFDLDRTLWDFDRNSKMALNSILEKENLIDKCLGFESFHKVYEQKNKLLWKKYGKGKLTKEALRYERFRAALKVFNVLDEEQICRIGDAYVELSPKQTVLFPNALAVLQDLKTMGFNLHIITNGFVEVQYKKMENTGLRPFFEVIVCSEDIGFNKPHPSIFEHAMREAKAKPTCSLMIGDDYRADISGAINAGMHAIWFEPNLKNTLRFENRITALNEIPQRAARLLGS